MSIDFDAPLFKTMYGRLDISRDLLFTGLAQFRWQLWDEVNNQPAGVGKWIDNGFLNGSRMTIAQYDAMLPMSQS